MTGQCKYCERAECDTDCAFCDSHREENRAPSRRTAAEFRAEGTDASRQKAVPLFTGLRQLLQGCNRGGWSIIVGDLERLLGIMEPTPRPFRDDTIESLEIKHATAQRVLTDMQQTIDRQRSVRDELRIAIAYKRGTCLCKEQRHASCQKQRPWCVASDCLCDTCRPRSANHEDATT